MKKALLGFLVIMVLLLLNSKASWALPTTGNGISNQPKTTVVVFLDPEFRYDYNKKAFNIIKESLKSKFINADIIFFKDNEAKSPAFLDFVEKIQTDPLNDKGIVWISVENIHKLGKDTNSDFVIILSLSGITNYYGHFLLSRLDLFAYDVPAAKIIAYDYWYKDFTNWASEVSEYLMAKLRDEYKWPNPYQGKFSEASSEAVTKPAVVVFLPGTILAKPQLVQKIKSTVRNKFKVADVPIYLDSAPKTSAFLSLAYRVTFDSVKQNTFIVRKEYLSEYGKLTNSNPMIVIKISLSDHDMQFWSSKSVYRFKEEVIVVDTRANKYLSNTVFDSGEKKRSQKVSISL